MLAYANNKSCVSRFFAPNTSDFPVLETEGERAGEYYECTKSLYQGSLDSRPNQRYYIECPDHSFIIPPGNIFPDEVRMQLLLNQLIIMISVGDGLGIVILNKNIYWYLKK